jgi:hypothetical protein
MEMNSEPKKARKPRLNARQRKFLRLMCDEVLTPEELLLKCKIAGHVFSAWMRDDAFAAEVMQTRRALRKQRKVEITISARVGPPTLAHQAKYAADGHVRRLASVNTIGLDMQQEEAEAKKKRRTPKEDAGPAMQELPPDLPPEESDRLLRIIEADGQPESSGESAS